jgi:hypothetical protein
MPFKSNKQQVMATVAKTVGGILAVAGGVGFAASQTDVPVVTGKLKESGAWAVFDHNGMLLVGDPTTPYGTIPSPGPTGQIQITIAYMTPYASIVATRNQTQAQEFMQSAFGQMIMEVIKRLNEPR